MKGSVLSLEEKNNTTLVFLHSNCPISTKNALNIFLTISVYDYYYTRLSYLVQFSICSTTALFCKYFVAMKYR